MRVFSKNADVHNFISKWRRHWPFLWGDLSFQFQCPEWTGVDFPATSVYPGIKCVFPSSVCDNFLKKCRCAQFYLKMAKVLTRFFWSFILSILTIDLVDFPATSFYPWIKCVFLLQSARVFSINADVHNFISKWRRPWPFLWGDLSFQFQCPQCSGVDFPATSFYPSIKFVFLLQSVRVFSKNADVHHFISKWRRSWPFLWGDLSFQFQRPEWTEVDFPATSFYPSIKFVFLLQSVRVFSKNADVHHFISKWRRSWPDFFGHLYFLF